MEALSYSITYNRGDGVTGNNVAKVLGVKRINQIQIKTWVNGLSKHSVTLNVYYDGRNDKLVFREAEKTYLSVVNYTERLQEKNQKENI